MLENFDFANRTALVQRWSKAGLALPPLSLALPHVLDTHLHEALSREPFHARAKAYAKFELQPPRMIC
jgi:hypothetical protein